MEQKEKKYLVQGYNDSGEFSYILTGQELVSRYDWQDNSDESIQKIYLVNGIGVENLIPATITQYKGYDCGDGIHLDIPYGIIVNGEEVECYSCQEH